MSGDEHEEQELLMRTRGSKFGRAVLIVWLSAWLAVGLGLLMLVQSHRTTPNKLIPVQPAGTQLSHAHDDSGLHGVRTASTTGRHSSPPPPPLPPRREEDSITLDGTTEAALRLVSARFLRRQGMDRLALLTFGNAGVKEHLLNFCAFAAKARAPHVVGAVRVFRATSAARWRDHPLCTRPGTQIAVPPGRHTLACTWPSSQLEHLRFVDRSFMAAKGKASLVGDLGRSFSEPEMSKHQVKRGERV